MIAFAHFFSFLLLFYLERFKLTALFFYVHFLFTVITLSRWWRSISILIRIFRNIVDDNSLIWSWNARNSLSSIMLCLKNDLFKRFYTAIYHNDSDCLECHLSRILSHRSSRSKMTTIVFDRLINSLKLILIKTCETCREFSLMMTNLIDKHFLKSFLSCTIQSYCDLIYERSFDFNVLDE